LSQRVTPSPLPGEAEGRTNEEEVEKIGSISSEKRRNKEGAGRGRKRRRMSSRRRGEG
jgi:hypothetical protein